MIWFISDTHFGHKNIVRGVSQWTDKSGCRDFATVEEHDRILLQQINTRVHYDDVLYHLGDWSFGGKDNIRKFRDRVLCKNIHLLIGNHDHHQLKHDYSDCFKSISMYHECVVNGTMVVLQHYPIESWCNMEQGSIHLHGHVHGNGRQMKGRYDVGFETPYWLLPETSLPTLAKAENQRHSRIEGGNKFGLRPHS